MQSDLLLRLGSGRPLTKAVAIYRNSCESELILSKMWVMKAVMGSERANKCSPSILRRAIRRAELISANSDAES